MLEVTGLFVRYGSIEAVHGIDIRVGPGELVALIGNNGAGKTSTLQSISGLARPHAGRIRLGQQEIAGRPPHVIVGLGLAHVPEGRHVFPDLTVAENLLMGAYLRKDGQAVRLELDRVLALFPILGERRNQPAGTLSGGEQQMLAIGRALMSGPRLLLLDEPSMGLAPMVVEKVFEIIVSINRQGTPILLVEQNAQLAIEVAHRAYVMETGQIVLSGPAAELAAREDIRRIYLGEGEGGAESAQISSSC